MSKGAHSSRVMVPGKMANSVSPWRSMCTCVADGQQSALAVSGMASYSGVAHPGVVLRVPQLSLLAKRLGLDVVRLDAGGQGCIKHAWELCAGCRAGPFEKILLRL